MDIELTINEDTSIIWLNGSELAVTEAKLTAGGKTFAVDAVPGGEDFLGFAIATPVKRGAATLHLTYSGRFSSRDSRGFFRQQDENRWYVVSQFEPVHARLAFPCFDEPRFKVPWQLTVEIRGDQRAFSNTPIASERELPDGFRVVEFAETKPLPSYLVALAVGPFEVVDARSAGRNHTPVRIITTQGKAAQARYAAEVAPQILERLENYFDLPYPFEKLDLLSVPITTDFTAMENVGLVTSAQTALLAKQEDEGIQFRRRLAGLCAHELAHMWFGDLVTTLWWDDIWLNEALATWMQTKLIDQWMPDWNHHTGSTASRIAAMKMDSLTSARRIRQPINSRHDIANAFDAITYRKGAAVLTMFESWVGEDKFRRGIQQYLQRYAFGNAKAADFLREISAAAGFEIGPAFSTFLDQPGFPVVSATLRCEHGTKPTLQLSQHRYLPVGASPAPEQSWQLPICARYGGRTPGRVCTLLSSEHADVELSVSNACPDWVLVNEGGLGYYRVFYEPAPLRRLLHGSDAQLSPTEQLALLDDIDGSFQAGRVGGDSFLGTLAVFANSPSRPVASAVASLTEPLSDRLIPSDQLPQFGRYVHRLFGERAKRLGWNPKPNESEDLALERSVFVPLVADRARDRNLEQEAIRLFRQWLADRSAVSPDLVDAVLWVASRIGDQGLFDDSVAQAQRAIERRDRLRLLGGLGTFTDPRLAQAAESYIVSERFDPRESITILWHQSGQAETRQLAYDYVKRGFDGLVERLPRDAGGGLPAVAGGFCDDQHEANMREFFSGRSAKFKGGPRKLELAAESVRLCRALKKLQQPSIVHYLQQY
jgi:alanyl aminopeptidase